ncbi:pyridoxine/pyridoxamine 5'-phosphate oxidase 2 isoform X2 [Dendrobium catenatum]|uniref:pyridoxine/pyridoxamine 5'-phosphate oxidase 2 isoform X2 n=1 Tax=Dendrobium catenatum TaxID=906689 RepID=UPI0009F66FDD|nr:pyridoxine/pyridoxamine 5'-phosphate oxidase 2 isoform X2 [Dendrobium catenatum]
MATGGATATAVQQWRALLAGALESNAHLNHSSYFQLATISVNGRPANRTVVFRGFQEGSDNILINTDRRTKKVEEITHNPYGEICWYFTESWEQFRINGRIDIIDCSTRDLAKLQDAILFGLLGLCRSIGTPFSPCGCSFSFFGITTPLEWFFLYPISAQCKPMKRHSLSLEGSLFYFFFFVPLSVAMYGMYFLI